MESWTARRLHHFHRHLLTLYPVLRPAQDRRGPCSRRSLPARKYHDVSAMTTTAEVATVPSADTPGTCIYLHHDKRSYIFGRLAEGTQRAFGSRKLHLGSTEHIFLSGCVGWDQMGGLIGFLLSVGGALDSAKEQLTLENTKREKKGKKLLALAQHDGIGIHGGDNLSHVLAACRPVIFRQPIRLRLFENRTDPRAAEAANLEPDWEDDAIRVWKVPVCRARSASPPKRPHSGLSGAASEEVAGSYKPPASVSDPEVASAIVERIMFSGSLASNPILRPCRVGDLKPTETAVTMRGGVLTAYKGPYASDDEEIPDADERAWLFPDGAAGELGGEEKKVENGLPVNHRPLPRTTYSQRSMSYIIKCRDRRGKFNVQQAKALGVAQKDFQRLTSGESVEAKDGTRVSPDMVLGALQPGRGLIVADIPSADFLDSFMERPEWKCRELMENVAVMYWILGPGLARSDAIQRFIRDHGSIERHVLCAPESCPNMITHPGPAEMQVKLRRLDGDRFPLPQYDNRVDFQQLPGAPSDKVQLGRAGLRLQLMPRLVFDDEAVAPFTDLVAAAQAVDDEVLALAKAAEAEAETVSPSWPADEDIPNPDAEVVPLGTGSSVPSKYRNVSATLIRVPGVGCYLLDCGEGTLGQLRRAFGPDQVADILRQLRCIVISHLHADHHLGAASLIKSWYQQTVRDGSQARLAVSCIGRYRDMLAELSQVDDLGLHRLRFPNCPWRLQPAEEEGNTKEEDETETDNKEEDSMEFQELKRTEKNKVKQAAGEVATARDLGGADGDSDHFGLSSIRRLPVVHCWRSHAVQLELQSGLRIAYSGDCRPSPSFADACRGAHLLVHECTFDSDRQPHARAKRHSTMAEALAVAARMAARRTLLTHFSQRYCKADSLRAAPAHGGPGGPVLLALDLMTVRLADFRRVAAYGPAVQALMERMAS